MTTTYSYCVLQYVHDFAAGEAINVGVLFYAPDKGMVVFRAITRTQALSQIFRGFDREEFMRFLTRLEASVERFQQSIDQEQLGLFNFEEKIDNAGVLARWLLPDNEMSFRFGQTLGGVTRDVKATSANIYTRLVAQQRPALKEEMRRDDKEVWNVFETAFREQGILRVLRPHTVQVPEFETPIVFQHAYKNERWHAVEPMSFDYANPRSIKEKSMLWFGYGAALKEIKEFSQLYLLLGAPTDKKQRKDFIGAKNWLAKMPIRPHLIEENEAQDFADDLASTMRKEGVLADAE